MQPIAQVVVTVSVILLCCVYIGDNMWFPAAVLHQCCFKEVTLRHNASSQFTANASTAMRQVHLSQPQIHMTVKTYGNTHMLFDPIGASLGASVTVSDRSHSLSGSKRNIIKAGMI